MSLPIDYWESSILEKNKNIKEDKNDKGKEPLCNLEEDKLLLQNIFSNKNDSDFSSSNSTKNKNKNDSIKGKENLKKVDNSLNLSYLLKQSSLIPENNDKKKQNSNISSTINNSINSIKRENVNSQEKNTNETKKVKTEKTNETILNQQQQQQNNTVNMIPQIQQYPINSINPAYPYYSNVNLFNPLVAQPPHYYPILTEQMNLQNQVPVISNYTAGNGSPQLPNSYINMNPLNIANPITPQIATHIASQIPNQLSAQITPQISNQLAQITSQISNQLPTQISPQIATQISPHVSQQITAQIPVQQASSVYPIFNINKNSIMNNNNNNNNKAANKSNSQAKVIDLTENSKNSNDDDKSKENNEELNIDANIDNDDKVVLFNKIKAARKKIDYYNNLCMKYEKFIDKALLKFKELEKNEESLKDIEKLKSRENNDPIIIDINEYDKNSEKLERQNKQNDKEKSEEIKERLEKQKKQEKQERQKRQERDRFEKEKLEKHNKENDIRNKENRLKEVNSSSVLYKRSNSPGNSSPKQKVEKNVISAPSLKEQFMNIKKRSSIDLSTHSSKRLKPTSENSNIQNKSVISSPPPVSKPFLSNNKSVSISQSSSSLNRRSPINSINNTIKVTNQNEEIKEIKIQSQTSKTRLLARNLSYIKKITKRKPRKFIHLNNSNNMIITDLGGEILVYNTKKREEVSVAYVANGGWSEDICSFSDNVFAISVLNKNRPSESQISMLSLKYGLGKPILHPLKLEKPHENGSIRLSPISEYNNIYRLVSAGSDHKLFFWEIREEDRDNFKINNIKLLHKSHSSAVQTVFYNSWNNTVYSGGSDCKLFGYNLTNNRMVLKSRYDMRLSNIIRNPVDPNQLLITYSNTKDQFRICDIRTKKTILNFGIPTNENVSQYVYPDFHKDGYLISFGSQNVDSDKASIYIWDIRYINPTNSYVSDIKLQQVGRVIKPSFHPFKNQIITIDTNGTAAFIDYQTVND